MFKRRRHFLESLVGESSHPKAKKTGWAFAIFVFAVFGGTFFVANIWNQQKTLLKENIEERLGTRVSVGSYQASSRELVLRQIRFLDFDLGPIDEVKIAYHWSWNRSASLRIKSILVRSMDVSWGSQGIERLRERFRTDETNQPSRSSVESKTRGFFESLREKFPHSLSIDIERLHLFDQTFKVHLASQLSSGDRHQFDGQVQSLDLTLNHDKIAPQSIGPLRLEVSAKGLFSLADHRVEVTDSQISIGKPQTLIRASLNGELTINTAIPNIESMDVSAEIKPTPCRALTEIDANRFTPLLREFDVSGAFGFAGKLRRTRQSENDHPFELNLERAVFDCGLSPTGKKDVNQTVTRTIEAIRSGYPIVTSFQRKSRHLNQRSTDRTIADVTEVPELVRHIFLLSEDGGFYQHDGVDFYGMAAAFSANLNDPRRTLGASTIPMQVAKNLFLGSDRNLSRKLQEIFLAKHLTKTLGKNRILTSYFNFAEFGPGLYGIANASEHFFGKTVPNLTPPEGAYLAAVLPAPVRRYQYFCQQKISTAMKSLVEAKLKKIKASEAVDASMVNPNGEIVFSSRYRNSSPYCSPGALSQFDSSPQKSAL